MAEPQILRDHVVVIEHDRIVELVPRTDADLAGAAVVDVTGKWIVPALADAHVHVHDPGDVALYLANGVTLVRNMWGKPWHLIWQRRVGSGEEVGPTVVTTSPIADGVGPAGTTVWPGSAVVRTRDEARSAAATWLGVGYQQVKAYSWLSAEALQGLGEACADHGRRLVGHCPQDVSFAAAIRAGQSCFEHLTNIEYGVLELKAEAEVERLLTAGEARFSAQVQTQLTRIDWTRMADLVGQMAEQRVYNCPTLVVLEQPYREANLDDARLGCIALHSQNLWLAADQFRRSVSSPEQRRAALEHVRQRNFRIVAMLADAGAPMLAGSDAHNPFVFPGSALIEELELLVEAGIAPLQAVQMATVDNSRFLGFDDRGQLLPGARAELVVLDGDPAISVSEYRAPSWVFTNGHSLDRVALDRLLEDRRTEIVRNDVGTTDILPASQAQRVYAFARSRLDVPDGRTMASDRSLTNGRRQLVEESVTPEGRSTSRVITDAKGWLQSAEVTDHGRFGHRSAHVTRCDDGSRYDITLRTLDGTVITDQAGAPLLPGPDLGAVAFAYAVRACDQDKPSLLSLTQAFASHSAPEVRTAERSVTPTGFKLTELSPTGNVDHDMQFVDGQPARLTAQSGLDTLVLAIVDD